MEPEQLGDALRAEFVESPVRPGEGLEPLEVARVRGWRGRERLDVGGERVGCVALVAGLREELGVLLEDLEVLLCGEFVCVCVRVSDAGRGWGMRRGVGWASP